MRVQGIRSLWYHFLGKSDEEIQQIYNKEAEKHKKEQEKLRKQMEEEGPKKTVWERMLSK